MKRIKDCTTDELKQVFEVNGELQHEIFNRMFDDAHYFNCQEYLPCWKSGIDYCIGYDRGAFFRCTDADGFIEGLKTAQRDFCFLPDEVNSRIEYVEHLIARRDNIVCWDYDNIERIESRIDDLCAELAADCFNRFMAEYEACFDDNNQVEYFIEVAADDYSGCYIDDNFVMYEDVAYTKKYA